MQILSWNINGLKACLKSDSFNFIYDILPDIICLQEIQTQEKPVITPSVDGVRWKTSAKKMTAAIWEIPYRRINMWILYPALL